MEALPPDASTKRDENKPLPSRAAAFLFMTALEPILTAHGRFFVVLRQVAAARRLRLGSIFCQIAVMGSQLLTWCLKLAGR